MTKKQQKHVKPKYEMIQFNRMQCDMIWHHHAVLIGHIKLGKDLLSSSRINCGPHDTTQYFTLHCKPLLHHSFLCVMKWNSFLPCLLWSACGTSENSLLRGSWQTWKRAEPHMQLLPGHWGGRLSGCVVGHLRVPLSSIWVYMYSTIP